MTHANRIASICLIAAKVLALLWAMTAPVSGQFRFFPPDDQSPGLESPEPPPHDEAAEQQDANPAAAPISRESGNAAIEHAPDLRPLVRVYSDPRYCAPCQRFEAWRAATADDAEPFRWQVETDPRRFPAWVTSVPVFVFRDSSGADRRVEGWPGIDGILRSFIAVNPAWQRAESSPSPRVDVSAMTPAPHASRLPGGIDLESLRKQFGDRGEFTWTPGKPVNATVRDGLTVRLTSVKGHYDLSGKIPTVTFDSPQPEGTATFWGWSVGYRVLGASLESSTTVAVKTNWKTVRISIDGGDQ